MGGPRGRRLRRAAGLLRNLDALRPRVFGEILVRHVLRHLRLLVHGPLHPGHRSVALLLLVLQSLVRLRGLALDLLLLYEEPRREEDVVGVPVLAALLRRHAVPDHGHSRHGDRLLLIMVIVLLFSHPTSNPITS